VESSLSAGTPTTLDDQKSLEHRLRPVRGEALSEAQGLYRRFPQSVQAGVPPYLSTSLYVGLFLS